MAKRKPVVIDGTVVEIPVMTTLADIVPREVDSVNTHDGRLIKRQDFARVPVPEGFETNLSPINRGGHQG